MKKYTRPDIVLSALNLFDLLTVSAENSISIVDEGIGGSISFGGFLNKDQ